MGYCDNLLKGDIKPDCDSPVVRGIEPNGVIINRADVDFGNIQADETRKNVIKTLPLKSDKKAYSIFVPTLTPFSGTITTLEAGTNRNSFTHNVGFIILDNSPDVAEKVIDPLTNGEFVIIYENKFKSLKKDTNKGDSAFQIVGLDQGLKASTLENDKWSEDTEGGWNVVMTETKSPSSATFLFNTDYDTTKTAVDTLTKEPNVGG